jgi:hypothetical protein
MSADLSKSERRKIRQLAEVAWDRQLRGELHKLAAAIADMAEGKITPFDVNEQVHRFHNGVSRDLFCMYSSSDPWYAVCRAHFDGVLTDDDLSDASDEIKQRIATFAANFAATHALAIQR